MYERDSAVTKILSYKGCSDSEKYYFNQFTGKIVRADILRAKHKTFRQHQPECDLSFDAWTRLCNYVSLTNNDYPIYNATNEYTGAKMGFLGFLDRSLLKRHCAEYDLEDFMKRRTAFHIAFVRHTM